MLLRTLCAALLFLLPGGCLLLQDPPPTSPLDGKCEDDNWCNEGLICVFPDGQYSTGQCRAPGSCTVDSNCPAGQLCQGTSGSSKIGECQENTGCISDTECATGATCYRGSCLFVCELSSECPEDSYCSILDDCPPHMDCPDACEYF
ncbi:Dickkopf N-terminal cysteine-rich domain-containing protein [Sorangium sp. So ce327]|jgi:hypothetical protein|uniref:hypothetical protein n=1 Tax=unclassified Sorangium TaxID=2621164 RepID=UPI003F5D9F11